MALLSDIEAAPAGSTYALAHILDNLKYNEAGLIAAIAQDYETRDVLMLAWMNRAAIEATLDDGWVTYYSRSRQSLWRKGETSGHKQTLRSMRFDCDGDAVLLTVEQVGPACHTNRSHCFYLKVQGEQIFVETDPLE